MIWLFIALTIFSLGSMIEYRTRGYPPLRPMPTTDAIWKVVGSISGVWFVVLFVWMLFVLTWWIVILFFVGAATAQGFLYDFVNRTPAAPLISMGAMIFGGIASALALHRLQVVSV